MKTKHEKPTDKNLHIDKLYIRSIVNRLWIDEFCKVLPAVNQITKQRALESIESYAKDCKHPAIRKEFMKKETQAMLKKYTEEEFEHNNYIVEAIKQASKSDEDIAMLIITVERVRNFLSNSVSVDDFDKSIIGEP